MMNNIRNYLNDTEFKLTIYDNKVHIINYDNIYSLSDDVISFKNKNKTIIIKGKSFFLSKILDREMLFTGLVKSVEVISE